MRRLAIHKPVRHTTTNKGKTSARARRSPAGLGLRERAQVRLGLVSNKVVVDWRTGLCMANWRIRRTDYGESTVANRHMAKRHHIDHSITTRI